MGLRVVNHSSLGALSVFEGWVDNYRNSKQYHCTNKIKSKHGVRAHFVINKLVIRNPNISAIPEIILTKLSIFPVKIGANKDARKNTDESCRNSDSRSKRFSLSCIFMKSTNS